MFTFIESNENLRTKSVGVWMLVVLYLVSFYSKSGVNFFSALAYILAIFVVITHNPPIFRREPLLLLLLIPLGFGLFESLFSRTGGWVGLVNYLNEFKFFFLPFVFSILSCDRRRLEWIFLAAFFSSILVIVYGFSHEEQRAFGMFHGYFVYPDVRTSQMMMVAVITSIVFLDDQEFRKRYPNATLMIALFVPIFFFSLIMGSIRSTWLGFGLSILAYAVFFRPRWLIPIITISVIMLFMGQETNISNELSSILDFRGNSSNNTRLQLWVTGWDFSEKNLLLGAGVNDIQNQFLDFYNAQSASYKEANHLVASSIGNFHNSYLQILIEWGVLTFGAFVLSCVILILKLVHALKTTQSGHLVFIRAFLVVSVGYLFSQFFHNELISYSATLYFLLMYSAIYAASISKYDE
ncbi:MAG: hypothetical protein DSZ28_03685 [Thiothrix sp.]|nr:MAG: hypothetical protein DSZ28_03685 [Thiothrix sp.]